MPEYRFNVFGRLVAIAGPRGARQAFYLGSEGKRRPADFVVPDDVDDNALAEYLADLFHEEATPRYGGVRVLNSRRDSAA